MSRTTRHALLTAALMTVGGMLVPSAATAFNLIGPKWAGKPAKITYHSTLSKPQDKWALQRALRAYNQNELNVRFVKASRKQAKVKIVRNNPMGCGNGLAELSWQVLSGSARFVKAKVHIGGCPGGNYKYVVGTVAVHELGHVTGLDHEDRGCATLNSLHTFNYGDPATDRPQFCPAIQKGNWRCRSNEVDDYKGVKKLYGGPLPTVGPYSCPLPGATSAGVQKALKRVESLEDDVVLRQLPSRE